jgi:hypothetical protein
MFHKIKPLRLALILSLWLCLGWIGITWQGSANADPRLESRINRLESDLRRLSSQVSRLESQLSIPRRPSSPSPPSPPVTAPVELSLDEQFDNLATLAVETKLQVRQLEERVTRLEQALVSPSLE